MSRVVVADLSTLRARIDALDDQLLRLLNERAALAREIGAAKREQGLPLHAPARERDIVMRLAGRNTGPFPTDGVRPVFQEIFRACLLVEGARFTAEGKDP